MEFSSLNWAAVLVAFLAAFFAGFLWFSPKGFYPVWWKAIGKQPSDVPGEANMGKVFGLTALGALGYTVVEALIVNAAGATTLGSGAFVGLISGVGLAALTSISHRLFSGQGLKVWAIEAGSDVLNLVIVGAIVGAMH